MSLDPSSSYLGANGKVSRSCVRRDVDFSSTEILCDFQSHVFTNASITFFDIVLDFVVIECLRMWVL